MLASAACALAGVVARLDLLVDGTPPGAENAVHLMTHLSVHPAACRWRREPAACRWRRAANGVPAAACRRPPDPLGTCDEPGRDLRAQALELAAAPLQGEAGAVVVCCGSVFVAADMRAAATTSAEGTALGWLDWTATAWAKEVSSKELSEGS